LQVKAEEERAALTARLEELEEVSGGAVAAAEADVKRAQEEAASKVEKNNERANEVRRGPARWAYMPIWLLSRLAGRCRPLYLPLFQDNHSHRMAEQSCLILPPTTHVWLCAEDEQAAGESGEGPRHPQGQGAYHWRSLCMKATMPTVVHGSCARQCACPRRPMRHTCCSTPLICYLFSIVKMVD